MPRRKFKQKQQPRKRGFNNFANLANTLMRPMGPSLKARLRFFKTVSYNTAGPPPFLTFCESIGQDVVSLTDFTNIAVTFARFTITHSKITCYLIHQDISALNSVAAAAYLPNIKPLIVGYFNDQVTAANPTSYASVGEDEQSRLVLPGAIKDKDTTMSVKIVPTQDPWSPTTAPTAAQQLQFGKFEGYGEAGSTALLNNLVGLFIMIEADVLFDGKI